MNRDDDDESLSTFELYGDLEDTLFEDGFPVAMKLKGYMIQKSVQRSTQILPCYPYPGVGKHLPSKLNAIDNMARGDPHRRAEALCPITGCFNQ